MKKITLSLIAIVFTINFSYAQWNSSGNNIYNTNTGAVGIGTTAPTAKLGVVGPSGNTIYSAQAGSGGEWAFGPNVGSTSGDDTFGIYSYTWGSAHSSKPLMQFNSTGNTFLNPDGGNVGIGTISPGVKLDVAGSVNISNGFNLTWGGAFGVGTPAMEGTGGTGLIFYPNGSTSGESMRISASGNVGIGTTSPAAKLQTNYLFTDLAGVSIQGGPSSGTALTIGGSAGDSGASVISVAPQWNTNASPYALDISPAGTANGTDTRLLNISFAGSNKMVVMKSGNVGVGTTNPDQKLTVKGTIHSQEVIVDMSVLPDYVFKSTYHLPTLSEVRNYIDQHHHLPEIPSAEDVVKDGLSLGDMNAKLLKKVEELTLYLIEQHAENKVSEEKLKNQQGELNNQKEINQFQQKEIDELKAQVSTLIKSKP